MGSMPKKHRNGAKQKARDIEDSFVYLLGDARAKKESSMERMNTEKASILERKGEAILRELECLSVMNASQSNLKERNLTN